MNKVTIMFILIICLVSGSLVYFMHNLVMTSAHEVDSKIILLDPGHGGLDGGAVSLSGVSEKDINLAICLEIARLAKAGNWKVVLTRKDDSGLYSGGTPTIRSKKNEDLRNRKSIMDAAGADAIISVHLNSFTSDTSVHGAQVFYAGEACEGIRIQSRKLAESVKCSLQEVLNDGTDRAILEKKGVLIMENPTAPEILVECGFLSNTEEAAKLKDRRYQRQIAEGIYSGVRRYFGVNHGNL